MEHLSNQLERGTSKFQVSSVSDCGEVEAIVLKGETLAVKDCESQHGCRSVADQVLNALFAVHKTRWLRTG